MEDVSYRQFLVWKKWLSNQWNKPSRTDHYLMQISSDIHNLVSKSIVKVTDRKLSWKEKTDPKDSESKRQDDLVFEQSIMRAVGAI